MNSHRSGREVAPKVAPRFPPFPKVVPLSAREMAIRSALAVSAVIISPVRCMRIACLRPMARVRATTGLEQNSPILTPGVPKHAVLEAIARSHEATSWQPAAIGQGFRSVDDCSAGTQRSGDVGDLREFLIGGAQRDRVVGMEPDAGFALGCQWIEQRRCGHGIDHVVTVERLDDSSRAKPIADPGMCRPCDRWWFVRVGVGPRCAGSCALLELVTGP